MKIVTLFFLLLVFSCHGDTPKETPPKTGDMTAVEYLKKVYEEEKARVAEKLYKDVKEQVLAKYNLDEKALVATKEGDSTKETSKNEEDPFDESKETVKTEPKKEEAGSGVRKRVPLFDPSFYDPDF